jgi:hypothetical protein
MKYPHISGVARVDSRDTIEIRRIYAASTTNIHRNTVVMCTASSGLFAEKFSISLMKLSMAASFYSTVIQSYIVIICLPFPYILNLNEYIATVKQAKNRSVYLRAKRLEPCSAQIYGPVNYF